MAKTARSARNMPSAPADEALKRRKKQARREAELMLAIEEAKKDLKKAQKKQSRVQAQLEAQNTSLHTLETRLAEFRSQSMEPENVTTPDSAELEHQQELSELESSMVRSNEEQRASPDQDRLGGIGALTDQATALPPVEEGMGIAPSSSETGTSTSTHEVPIPPIIEEATPSEVIVVTNEVIDLAAEQEKESATATELAQATPEKAPAQKTTAARTTTVTKRPASRSRSSKQPSSDAE